MKRKEIVIEANKKIKDYWKEIWMYRELFFFLSWKDVLVQYKQTIIGIIWAVIKPLLTMVVFTVVFGRIANLPSQGVPYPILVYSASLPWHFFATSLAGSSNAFIGNANMITKIYFPRIILIGTSQIVALIDFLIGFSILLVLMLFYNVPPGVELLMLPIFLILASILSFGISLILGSLNVKYRDFRIIIPFIVQLGLFISPVGFSSSIVPENLKFVYSLNPMVGVIEGFRMSIIGDKAEIYLPGFLISIGVSIVLLFTGLWYFRRMERSFADVI